MLRADAARHLLILAAALVVSTGTSSAQTGASAGDDAVDWLRTNLGGAACVVYQAGPSAQRLERVEENTEVQFDGCRMTLQQATVNGEHSQVQTFDVRLATLDGAAITMREWADLPAGWISTGDVPTHTVAVAVAEGQPPIDSRVETFNGLAPITAQTRTVDILVRHQENAARIVRALKQAVESCRAAAR